MKDRLQTKLFKYISSLATASFNKWKGSLISYLLPHVVHVTNDHKPSTKILETKDTVWVVPLKDDKTPNYSDIICRNKYIIL